MSELPETRFTRAGDVDLAYQIVGPAGGLDLVFVPGWVPHLEARGSASQTAVCTTSKVLLTDGSYSRRNTPEKCRL